MKWFACILLFGAVCAGDSIRTDTINQIKDVVVNNEKKEVFHHEIDKINGKLDSIIAELTRDTIK